MTSKRIVDNFYGSFVEIFFILNHTITPLSVDFSEVKFAWITSRRNLQRSRCKLKLTYNTPLSTMMMKQTDTPTAKEKESNTDAVNKMMKFFGSKKICSKSIKLPEKVRNEDSEEGGTLLWSTFDVHVTRGCFSPDTDPLDLSSFFIVICS